MAFEMHRHGITRHTEDRVGRYQQSQDRQINENDIDLDLVNAHRNYNFLFGRAGTSVSCSSVGSLIHAISVI